MDQQTKVYCSGCHKEIPSTRAYWEVRAMFFCDKKCWLAYKEANEEPKSGQ